MNRTTEFTTQPQCRSGAGQGAGQGAGLSVAWSTARRVARHALGWAGRIHRARQLMHQLGGLADHELRDIGLTRLDLRAAGALPLDADPSSLLRRRAEEGRRRR